MVKIKTYSEFGNIKSFQSSLLDEIMKSERKTIIVKSVKYGRSYVNKFATRYLREIKLNKSRHNCSLTPHELNLLEQRKLTWNPTIPAGPNG